MIKRPSRAGIERPVKISSTQAKTRKSRTAGQAPSHTGYRTAALREPRSASPHPKIADQGLTTAHTFPTSAERYANPTHHATQMAVGAMLRVGLWLPSRLAAKIRANSATETTRAASR